LEGRIDKLEASLAAKEKFSLWLHRAKAAGGFVPYWETELKGPLAPLEWFENEEAYFLFRLVNDVNLTILKSASTNQDLRFFCPLRVGWNAAADLPARQVGRLCAGSPDS
jgi:hypothetical protein